MPRLRLARPQAHQLVRILREWRQGRDWEATVKRVDPAFFAQHSVTELYGWHDHDLEDAGRLTNPLRYDPETDHFVPISWDEAYMRIGTKMREMDHPDRMEFYTSGRASNEAAFLYQLLARAYGTNNFPDCSNMCHEATSVGLPKSIGVGKGTVTLDDFDYCDALFCIGHNPGTNHPRMLTTLREVSRRGVPIVVANPLKERGLERFESPQDPLEMLTLTSTKLASAYHQVKVGGDIAMFKGMMKALLNADRMNLATGGDGLLDRAFIAEHTLGFEALRDDVDAMQWDDIERRSGLRRAAIESMARVYWEAERVIICYGMGLTQHRHGTENVQQLANLMLLRGNVGKQGAGISPLRGHSNVQGDRTVGITELPGEAFLGRLDKAFGIASPRKHGHNAVDAVAAMRDGTAKGFIGLGGNLAVAMSDPVASFAAFRNLEMNVQICTKLNRTCLLTATQESIILPCLGRTELDVQATGPQAVTVEDSMSMVHASRGRLKPASPALRSELAIIAGIARWPCPRRRSTGTGCSPTTISSATRSRKSFPTSSISTNASAIPAASACGSAPRTANGTRRTTRRISSSSRAPTRTKAATTGRSPSPRFAATTSTTPRSTASTTAIAASPDGADVIFVHADDLAAQGLAHGDRIDVVAGDRVLPGQTAVAYGIARGSVAAYYPEANVLMPLEDYDRHSGTPSYKSVAVTLRAAA